MGGVDRMGRASKKMALGWPLWLGIEGAADVVRGYTCLLRTLSPSTWPAFGTAEIQNERIYHLRMQAHLFKSGYTSTDYYFKIPRVLSVKFKFRLWFWAKFTLQKTVVMQKVILAVSPSRSYGVMVSTLDFESSDPSSNLGRTSHNLTPWRNGSASDSRSEGCVFESRRGQNLFPTSWHWHFCPKSMPPMRIELMTFGLQDQRSATEL